jgi:hypothetical protein
MQRRKRANGILKTKVFNAYLSYTVIPSEA